MVIGIIVGIGVIQITRTEAIIQKERSRSNSTGTLSRTVLRNQMRSVTRMLPVVPLKKRGRPCKQPLISRGTARENALMSASTPPHRDAVFGGVGGEAKPLE
ncbi:hypothetical protein TNIN_251901 [Trichonephila inaurata madagascariensis]|uniref:Uncharacterized protein n=1 Tax=Trichonephila inaurata madagascariensis TaxID=2747483 RepID=A0A8X7BVU6_9ARAC|nr:hypothetical protein TNIN_251901 [Trichonephila inaurata madagascariensis]